MYDDDPSLEPLSNRDAALLMGAPVVIALLSLGALWLIAGGAAVGFVVGTASVSVLTAAGKFVILAGIPENAPVGPLGLAVLVFAMDSTAALMLIPVMPLIYKVPLFGKHLSAVRAASQKVLERNRWMRRFTYAGLITYVAVPFGGTGALGAVFLGRLLGLGRRAIAVGTFVGAALGAGLIYAVALLGQEYVDALRDNPYLTLGGILLVGLVGMILLWRLVRNIRQNRQGSSPSRDLTRAEAPKSSENACERSTAEESR